MLVIIIIPAKKKKKKKYFSSVKEKISEQADCLHSKCTLSPPPLPRFNIHARKYDTRKSQPTKTIDNSHFKSLVPSRAVGLKIRKEALDDGNSNDVHSTISSCAGAKRNETRRVCSQFIEALFHRKNENTKRDNASAAYVSFSPSFFPFHSLSLPPTLLFFSFLFFFFFFVYKPRHVIISRRYPLIKLLSLIFLVPTRVSGVSLSTPRCISTPLPATLFPVLSKRLLHSLNLDFIAYTRGSGSARSHSCSCCTCSSPRGRLPLNAASTATLCRRRTFDALRHARIPFDKRIREATKFFSLPFPFHLSPPLFPSVVSTLFAPVSSLLR